MKKDNRKLTEEEKKALEALKEALDNDPEIIRQRRIVLMFSYGLHPNFLIHVVLMLLINLVVMSSILGIPNFGVVKDPWLYVMCVVLFTFIELSIKMLITRLLQAKRLYSVGLVDLILIPIFYLTLVLPKAILFDHVWKIVIFVVGFLVIRFFVSYYIKKYFYRRAAK